MPSPPQLTPVWKVLQTEEPFYEGGPWVATADHLFVANGSSIRIKAWKNSLDSEEEKTEEKEESAEKERNGTAGREVMGGEPLTLEGDGGNLTAVGLTSSHFVATSLSGLILLWDLPLSQDSKPSQRWKGPPPPVTLLGIQRSQKWIATGGPGGDVWLWDEERGVPTHRWKSAIPLTTFRWRGTCLLAGRRDGSIVLWDPREGPTAGPVWESQNHFGAITCLQIDEQTGKAGELFSTSQDGLWTRWAPHGKGWEKTLGVPVYHPVEGILLLGEWCVSAAANGQLSIWERSGKLVRHVTPAALHMGIVGLSLLDSTRFVVLTVDQTFVEFSWAVSQEEGLTLTPVGVRVGNFSEIHDVTYLPDSTDRVAVAATSPLLHLWDLRLGTWEVLQGHQGTIISLATAPSGPFVASAGTDNQICVWNCSHGHVTLAGRLEGHTNHVTTVAFFHKRLSLLSGGRDMTIKVWELSWDKKKGTLNASSRFTEKAHGKEVTCVAVAPNDRLMASGSQDKTIAIWRTDPWELVGTLKGHRRGVWHVTFSPVEATLLSAGGDKTLRLWKISDLTCLRTFEGHTSSVLRAQFLPTGQQFLSSGSDGLLKVWEVKTSEAVGTFAEHSDRVWGLTLRGDGKEVITGGADATLRRWEDRSVEAFQEQQAAAEQIALQEQRLQGWLAKRQFSKAFGLAFALAQPFRVLTILETLLLTESGKEELIELVSKWSMERVETSLTYIRQWNTNAKHALVAQQFLHILFTIFPPNVLSALPNAKELFEGILPYTERHLNRMDILIQRSYLIDYTRQRMNVLSEVKQEPPQGKVKNFEETRTPKRLRQS